MAKDNSLKILGFRIDTTINHIGASEDVKLINTLNPHSYLVSRKDKLFQEALQNSDILLPDGIGIVMASRWLYRKRIKKIAGADLFYNEMKRLNKLEGRCFFLGSSNETLNKISERANKEYPNVKLKCLSPPFKNSFSIQENRQMVDVINSFKPDVLFIGMTAPKQEKWAYEHASKLSVGHICCIGAVFDFYAGTINRAPQWMINIGLEWLYRLIREPKRMWRRYIIGNTIFILLMIKEKVKLWINR
jgi:N-acetylglucosaminyldiphosphoundecaprenol N-acetyl-beta-D-mannosaminyltransferase